MSGVCGIAFRDRSHRLHPSHLSPMLRALNFRGKDEGSAVVLDSIAVGAQRFQGRLAGVAEIALQQHSLALAFHGSLYNQQEFCRVEGLASDPIVKLLSLYLEEGIAFLQRIRGEFVLALWDGREEMLYLATDRFRVHPLFYYHTKDELVFASRMKALLACPFVVKRTINFEAIVDLMAFSTIPTPKTIFQEVKKLPPGHLLTYQKGGVHLTPYWDINFARSAGAAETELAHQLKSHLSEAVAVRLEPGGTADQSGCFLSGGVDSSTVAGLLTQAVKHPIKSFSIGFDDTRFSEIDYARTAARFFGVQHYEYFVTPRDTYDSIPDLLAAFDEPFANASAIPTYFCAKMAKEHEVDVLFAGDGGDELFAGNERYAVQRLFECYAKVPGWLRESLVKPLVFTLADARLWELFVKGKRYIQRASIPYPERLWTYGFFSVVATTELFEDSLLKAIDRDYNPYAPVSDYYHKAPAWSELDRQLYIDLKLAISDNDLFKVMRMTEAAGVTVRLPFLDHRLAEFAARIPAHIKMRRRNLRSFFKKTYADLLPPATLTKKKHGFGLPIPIWLRTDRRLNEMMHDLVLSPRSIQRGYFKKRALEDLIVCHKSDDTSFYGTALWNLMILELWHRICC